jgi:hypothetical protein
VPPPSRRRDRERRRRPRRRPTSVTPTVDTTPDTTPADAGRRRPGRIRRALSRGLRAVGNRLQGNRNN